MRRDNTEKGHSIIMYVGMMEALSSQLAPAPFIHITTSICNRMAIEWVYGTVSVKAGSVPVTVTNGCGVLSVYISHRSAVCCLKWKADPLLTGLQ